MHFYILAFREKYLVGKNIPGFDEPSWNVIGKKRHITYLPSKRPALMFIGPGKNKQRSSNINLIEQSDRQSVLVIVKRSRRDSESSAEFNRTPDGINSIGTTFDRPTNLRTCNYAEDDAMAES